MLNNFPRRGAGKPQLWNRDFLVMNALYRQLEQQCPLLNGRILDLGCGNRPYQQLLVNSDTYIAYDLDVRNSMPEIAGSAQALPFATGAFDGVLSTQVLEHVPEPWVVIDEIARVLRPGGLLVLSAPQSWRLHEQPYDFYRYTRFGLEYLLRRAGITVIHVFAQGGVWRNLGQMVNNTLTHDRAINRFSSAWFMRTAAICAVNIGCGVLDHVLLDVDDTLNYVVVARRC